MLRSVNSNGNTIPLDLRRHAAGGPKEAAPLHQPPGTGRLPPSDGHSAPSSLPDTLGYGSARYSTVRRGQHVDMLV